MHQIKLLVMDVDGTLTDGKLYYSSEGEFCKAFDVKDGYGIAAILPKMGIIPAVITGRRSEIVAHRCSELGISHLKQGVMDKAQALRDLQRELSILPEETAYIGDDLNDLPAMEYAGLTGCPSDASSGIPEAVDYICKKPGGRGAVREFIEWFSGR